MNHLLTLTLGFILPQDLSSPPVGETQEQWILFDKVALVVNEDIITHRDFLLLLERERRRNPISTQMQEQDLATRALVDESDRVLGSQAGQDLGLPEAMIEQNVSARIDSLIEYKGVVEFSEQLQDDDINSTQLRSEFASNLYHSYWEEVVTGRSPSIGGRILSDRFVRPGYLKLQYDANIRNSGFLQEIGGSEEEVILRELTVPSRGRPEESQRTANEILDRALIAGEAFVDLVAELNPRAPNQGLTESIPSSRLKEVMQALDQFVSQAAVGDVSRPMPIVREDELKGWVLFELVEVIPAIRPAFEESGVQSTLSKLVQRNLDESRLFRALDRLYQGAYIWPENVYAGRPAIAPRLGLN